jgi:hypothetical protein
MIECQCPRDDIIWTRPARDDVELWEMAGLPPPGLQVRHSLSRTDVPDPNQVVRVRMAGWVVHPHPSLQVHVPLLAVKLN